MAPDFRGRTTGPWESWLRVLPAEFDSAQRVYDEFGEVAGRYFLEAFDERCVSDITAMKREMNTKSTSSSTQLFLQHAVRIQVSRRYVYALHRFRIAPSRRNCGPLGLRG